MFYFYNNKFMEKGVDKEDNFRGNKKGIKINFFYL